MPKVVLADPALAGWAAAVAERLGPRVEVVAVAGFDDADLAAVAHGATVLVDARRPIGRSTLDLLPDLRLVQMIGAGYDPLDRIALAEAGVTVATNPGVNRIGVAEHTLLLMLALVKRLPQSEPRTRAGAFPTAELIAAGIGDLVGARIGLVGLGAIGLAVAERLAGFGSEVVYTTRRPVPDAEARLGVRRVSLDELLATSALVSLHVPLTPETHHLIGAAELARMPRGAFLVNCARGGLVDEDALRDAIVRGHLAGAALDVLEREIEGVNPFADLPQVLVTPHIGAGSRHSMAAAIERTTANIARFLAGEPLADVLPPPATSDAPGSALSGGPARP